MITNLASIGLQLDGQNFEFDSLFDLKRWYNDGDDEANEIHDQPLSTSTLPGEDFPLYIVFTQDTKFRRYERSRNLGNIRFACGPSK